MLFGSTQIRRQNIERHEYVSTTNSIMLAPFYFFPFSKIGGGGPKSWQAERNPKTIANLQNPNRWGVGVMTKTLNAIRYLLLECVYELLHN